MAAEQSRVSGAAAVGMMQKSVANINTEATATIGHKEDGSPWEGVARNSSFPQPAGCLPGHHAPTKPPPGTRYPNPKSDQADPAFTALLYEDPEIRVFENRIVPGLLGPKHSHDLDYWLVCAHKKGPGKITAQQAPKWQLVSLEVQEGNVAFVKKGGLETADNPPESPLTIFYAIEVKDNAERQKTPEGWGASAGVLFENTEVKIQDLRVPPGEVGCAPLMGQGVSQVFHVDVGGTRKGARPMEELKAIKEGRAAGFPQDKWGNTYRFTPSDAGAGQAVNEGSDYYRGVIVEVKDVAPQLTSRL